MSWDLFTIGKEKSKTTVNLGTDSKVTVSKPVGESEPSRCRPGSWYRPDHILCTNNSRPSEKNLSTLMHELALLVPVEIRSTRTSHTLTIALKSSQQIEHGTDRDTGTTFNNLFQDLVLHKNLHKSWRMVRAPLPPIITYGLCSLWNNSRTPHRILVLIFSGGSNR